MKVQKYEIFVYQDLEKIFWVYDNFTHLISPFSINFHTFVPSKNVV